MYRCEICGTIFDAPYTRETSDHRPDGYREKSKSVLCPACFEPYFKEIREDEEN